jgi:hypothetical protein
MTVTITNGGGGALVFTFSKTAPSGKLTDLANKAAEYLFNKGYGNHGTPEAPRKFADLSNAEKMNILDQFITEGLKSAAQTQHVESAVQIARTTAEQTGDYQL